MQTTARDALEQLQRDLADEPGLAELDDATLAQLTNDPHKAGLVVDDGEGGARSMAASQVAARVKQDGRDVAEFEACMIGDVASANAA